MAKGPMWAEARQQAVADQEKRRRAKINRQIKGDAYSEDDDEDEDADTELKAKVVRHFGKSASRILKMVNNDENTDGAVILLQRALLSSSITALTLVEDTTLKTQGAKGVYAYNALISQIRELLADVQSSQDTARIAAELGDRVTLALRGVAEAVLDQHHAFKRELEAYLSEEDVKTVLSRVDDTSRSIATYISQARKEINEAVRSRLCD